jgi:predicted nucleic acid-binding protein
MTVVLDAGGVSTLAGQRARLAELRRRGHWPAHVPAVVLTEALTGDHRRDFHANRLLRACLIQDVDELQAREGARLRTCTGHAGTISATDAIVAAVASTVPDPVVLTSDAHDLDVLAGHTARPIRVAPVC